jgi:hypothetical protein
MATPKVGDYVYIVQNLAPPIGYKGGIVRMRITATWMKNDNSVDYDGILDDGATTFTNMPTVYTDYDAAIAALQGP